MDPRFGRCAYFIIVDSDTMEFEAIQNEAAAVPAGAGILAVQIVVSKNVEAVITGGVGPSALPALEESDIKIFATRCGTVRKCIEEYKVEGLQTIKHPILNRGRGFGCIEDRGQRRLGNSEN